MFPNHTTGLQRFRVLGLFLLGALPLVCSAATPCAYRGLDADARVMNRSGEVSTPFPMSLASNDCSRLRVANGTVAVYAVGPDRQRFRPQQVSRGPLMTAVEGAAVVGSDILATLEQMKLVLEGVNRTKTGSSRGGEGESLVASLPSGKLAEPSADLTLELGPAPDLNLASFELLAGGKAVHRQSGPSQSLRLPRSVLKAGSALRWKLNYGGNRYEGAFTVEPASALAALKASLQQEVPPDSDALVTSLNLATDLILAGYAWDAREQMRAALTPAP